jgi:hypothetical protein
MWQKAIFQQEKRKSIDILAVHVSECGFLNDALLAFEANLRLLLLATFQDESAITKKQYRNIFLAYRTFNNRIHGRQR